VSDSPPPAEVDDDSDQAGGSVLEAARLQPRSTLPTVVFERVAEGIASRWGHALPLRLLVAMIRVFRNASGTARSAEIAYWGILSTIPFAALCLTIVAMASSVVEAGMTDEQLLETARTLADSILPAAGADLQVAIAALLRERGALGAFGFVTLVMTSSLVFGAVNRALGCIFERRARGRITTVMVFSIVLVALTLFFVIGAPALSTIAAVVGAERLLGGVLDSPLWFHLGGALSMALSFAFFITFVVRAAIRPAWINVGTVAFVALFELARWGVHVYLETVTNFNVVYGSLAGVMAAILWAYYISFSLLLTMSLVRTLQDRLHATPLGDLTSNFEPTSEGLD